MSPRILKVLSLLDEPGKMSPYVRGPFRWCTPLAKGDGRFHAWVEMVNVASIADTVATLAILWTRMGGQGKSSMLNTSFYRWIYDMIIWCISRKTFKEMIDYVRTSFYTILGYRDFRGEGKNRKQEKSEQNTQNSKLRERSSPGINRQNIKS